VIRLPSAAKRAFSSSLRFLLSLAGAAGATALGHASEEAQTLTFAAYNLRNYLRMERRSEDAVVPDAPKPEHEIAAVLTILSAAKPDILGVTEMGTQGDLDDFRLRLERAGLSLPHTTLVLGADEQRHIALLSKFPVVATRHQTSLSYRIGAVRLPMQRGILDAEIEVRDRYALRVLGVHLKSRRQVEEADQAEQDQNDPQRNPNQAAAGLAQPAHQAAHVLRQAALKLFQMLVELCF
jgi:hypothetical protein